MPLVSVPAIYDGKRIRLLEGVPAEEPYRVQVTFIEPTHEEEKRRRELDRFWASFGAWRDERPVEAILQDIHEARRSKTEAPVL